MSRVLAILLFRHCNHEMIFFFFSFLNTCLNVYILLFFDLIFFSIYLLNGERMANEWLL